LPKNRNFQKVFLIISTFFQNSGEKGESGKIVDFEEGMKNCRKIPSLFSAGVFWKNFFGV